MRDFVQQLSQLFGKADEDASPLSQPVPPAKTGDASAIAANCDDPALGTTARVGHVLRVDGWAFSSRGIRSVVAYVDDEPIGTVSHGLRRPDVAAAYPDVPEALNSGFRGYFALSTVPAGTRELRIRITDNGGTVAELKGSVAIDHTYSDPERILPDLDAQFEIWLRRHRPTADDLRSLSGAARRLPCQPLISILMPVYNTPEEFLRLAIQSVLAQVYPRWELCIVDDGSTEAHVRAILADFTQRDPRIRARRLEANRGIAGATHAAFEMASGEFIGLLDHDDELWPNALYECVKLLNEHRDADVIYSDEDKITEDGQHYDPFFKPDWSPDLLLSMMYTGHFSVYRRSIVEAVGGFRGEFSGSQDYDLILRVTEQTDRVYHIPTILYSWRAHPGSAASSMFVKSYALDAARRALGEAIERRGLDANVEPGIAPGSWRIRYRARETPAVTLVIPTDSGGSQLSATLESILRLTSYPNFEVIVVGSEDSANGEVESVVAPDSRVRYLASRANPANRSALINYAVRHAASPFIVVLDDDLTVADPGWLEAMLEHARRPEVGVVGAKLLYPDGSIQHAGLVAGLGGVAGHIFRRYPPNHHGYFGLIDVVRNYSAVSFACAMFRRSVFEDVGGLDADNLPAAFNDVDFCLRVRQRGYRIVYTPHAVLYHHESPTETDRSSPTDAKFMQSVWAEVIDHDPAFNPNFTRYRENCSLAVIGSVLRFESESAFADGVPRGSELPRQSDSESVLSRVTLRNVELGAVFNPLDHPICLELPERLTDVSSWHPHIPFAFVLVQLVRPAVLVELGVHKGDSYCAFCQAVATLGLDTRCYGIDSLQGDAHVGTLGESTLLELKEYHDPRYGHFSTLLHCSFDEAIERFHDGSVDLLHIDGHHTYEAVKHDFETWLPKMSPKGIVLLHDTNVRDADFGVWRLFDELKERYPTFAFQHGHGLGVLAVGSDVPPDLKAFFANDDEAVAIAQFFSLLGSRIAPSRDQSQRIAQVEAEVSSVRDLLRQREERLHQENRQVAWLEHQLAESRAAQVQKDDLLRQKVDEARQLALRLEQLEAKFADVQEAYRQTAFDLEALRGTYSVRLSRSIGERIKRLRRGVSRFRRRQTPIEGNIDRPRENSRVSGATIVEGWAYSTAAEVTRVEVLLQHTGELLGTATHALERPDVLHAHPGLAHKYCGYRATVNLASVPTGRQVLVVRVTDAAGNRQEFARGVQVAEATEAVSRPTTGASIAGSVVAAPAPMPDASNAALEAFAKARLRTLLDADERLVFPKFANPLVSVVVPTFNQAHYTYLAFESLLSAGWEIPFELVVVDNGSTDETKTLLQRLDNVRVQLNDANLGFGKACDAGAALARGEYICFLNSDAFVTPGWLKSLVQTIETYPRCGAVGAKLVYPSGKLQEAGSIIWDDGSALGYGRGANPDDPEFCHVREVDFCSAACLLIRRQLFLDLGGFDERFAPAYYEDADLCMAVRAADHVVVYQPNATVFHVENGSGDASKAVTLQVRNQAKFVAKWHERLRNHHSAKSFATLSARDRRCGRRVLVVDDRVPDPSLGSGFPRARALLHSLADLGFVVTLLAREPSVDSRVATELRQRGIEVVHGVADLQEKLAERSGLYDVAIVSRPHNAMYIDIIRRSSPRTAIVYDAEAIYALRDIRQAQILGEALPDSVAEARIRNELAPMTSADVVVAVSEVERRLIERYQPGARVVVWGHPIVAAPGANDFHERADLLFVGYLATPPNADAIMRLLTEIFPKLTTELDCRLIVVGSSPPDEVITAAAKLGDRVVFTGYVDDLTSFYDQCRVFVAPHRFGAGIPLKVIESMAHGVPCVVSRLLAEQLQVEDGAEVLVADDAQQFVDRIARLYRDPVVWRHVRQQALHAVNARYNPTVMKDALAHCIDEALIQKNGNVNGSSAVPVDERVR